MEADEVRIVDNPDELRYELRVQDSLAGFITYRRRPGTTVLVHTEIDPAYEGRGLGSRLVAGALEDVRSRGLGLVPLCPFVSAYIRRHPEYREIVVPDPVPSD